jgi:hypothetical protein
MHATAEEWMVAGSVGNPDFESDHKDRREGQELDPLVVVDHHIDGRSRGM